MTIQITRREKTGKVHNELKISLDYKPATEEKGDLTHILITSIGVAYSILPGMNPDHVVIGKTKSVLEELATVYTENHLPPSEFESFVSQFIDLYTGRAFPKSADNPYKRGLFLEQIGYDKNMLQKMAREFTSAHHGRKHPHKSTTLSQPRNRSTYRKPSDSDSEVTPSLESSGLVGSNTGYFNQRKITIYEEEEDRGVDHEVYIVLGVDEDSGQVEVLRITGREHENKSSLDLYVH